jgi:hypothetical protein
MPFGTSKTYGFSNEIIPFLVISGTGNGVGVFVYNGTPQLGNPPIAWLTNGSLVDPYGNVLPAVMGIAGVGEFSAGNAIITPAGLFLYTPGGVLSFSLATVGGFDPKNNKSFPAGIWVYNTTGGGGVGLQSGTEPTVFLIPPNVTNSAVQPSISAFSDFAGAVNELTAAVLFSGNETANSGNAAVQVFSESNDGTIVAQGDLVITGVSILNWTANGLFVSTGNGTLTGRPDFTQTDTTTDTNANLSGANPMTKQWTIPANEAQVGAVYEIVSPFTGTNAATVEAYGFKPFLNGAALTTTGGDIVGATMLAIIGASTAWVGEVKLMLKVISVGTGGTVQIFIKGGLNNQGNIQGGSSASSCEFSSALSPITHAFNTTIANTIGIASEWGASSTGQTSSNFGSTFTRKGP